MVKKVIKKVVKQKPKPKQKQKQKQLQRQNVVVNISNPKQQKEDKGYLPMMPSFNFPPPQQQSSLGDISKLLNFISNKEKTESKLGVSIPVVKPTEPIKENNFPLESNVKESLLGEAINNKNVEEPKEEQDYYNRKMPLYEEDIEGILLTEAEVKKRKTNINTIKNLLLRYENVTGKRYEPKARNNMGKITKENVESFKNLVEILESEKK